MRVESPLFLTVAPVGSKFSASHCGQFIPRSNATSTYVVGGWVYSRGGLAHYPLYISKHDAFFVHPVESGKFS